MFGVAMVWHSRQRPRKEITINARFLRFNFANDTIKVSKSAIKKASNPASDEFKAIYTPNGDNRPSLEAHG